MIIPIVLYSILLLASFSFTIAVGYYNGYKKGEAKGFNAGITEGIYKESHKLEEFFSQYFKPLKHIPTLKEYNDDISVPTFGYYQFLDFLIKNQNDIKGVFAGVYHIPNKYNRYGFTEVIIYDNDNKEYVYCVLNKMTQNIINIAWEQYIINKMERDDFYGE